MEFQKEMGLRLEERLAALHTQGSGTVGDMLQLRLLEQKPAQGEYVMCCATDSWMRNLAGTLHGGLCATLLDQAMGCVAYCAMPGLGTAPTIDLQISYHRPLIPGEEVLLRVRVLSCTKSLMRLTAEASSLSQPERLCLSGSGTYFYKPME